MGLKNKHFYSLMFLVRKFLELINIPNFTNSAYFFDLLTGGYGRREVAREGFIIPPKDYRGVHRLLSYMNKDEGSEENQCCQVFANFSSSVAMFIRHIFCINFVIINFVTYKLRYL
jgi:hypothetical protein